MLREPEFANERDDRLKVLVNACIFSKADRTRVRGENLGH